MKTPSPPLLFRLLAGFLILLALNTLIRPIPTWDISVRIYAFIPLDEVLDTFVGINDEDVVQHPLLGPFSAVFPQFQGYYWKTRSRLCLCAFPFWVLFQDDKSLHYVTDGDILLVLQLGTLSIAEKYGCRLSLPSGNGLGLTCLTNDVDGLTDSYSDLQRLEVLIKCDKESGVQGSDQVVEKVMRITQDERLGVDEGDESGQQTSGRDTRKHAALSVEGAEGKCALSCVKETLGDTDHEEGVGVAVVVRGKLPEELCKSGVVGSGTDQTHGEDGVDGDIVVVIVRVTR